MSSDWNYPRVMAVHAHPDDESLTMGVTLAALTRADVPVRVVTCTMGEQGEVIGGKYQNLIADHADQLGGYRIGELARALHALGIPGGPQFLGGSTTWRDSGMAGDPSMEHPRSFAGGDEHNSRDDRLAQQVAQLKQQIQDFAPTEILTYDPHGGYGHPDHIQVHHVVHQAVEELASDPNPDTHVPSAIYWAANSADDAADALAGVQPPAGWRLPTQEETDNVTVPDADIAFKVAGQSADVEAKAAALRAHATQVWVADGTVSDVNPDARTIDSQAEDLDVQYYYALSNFIVQPLMEVESFQCGWGTKGRPDWPISFLG